MRGFRCFAQWRITVIRCNSAEKFAESRRKPFSGMTNRGALNRLSTPLTGELRKIRHGLTVTSCSGLARSFRADSVGAVGIGSGCSGSCQAVSGRHDSGMIAVYCRHDSAVSVPADMVHSCSDRLRRDSVIQSARDPLRRFWICCELFRADLARIAIAFRDISVYMPLFCILRYISGGFRLYRSNVPCKVIPALNRTPDTLKRKRVFFGVFSRNNSGHNNSRRTFYFAFCGVLCVLSVSVYYAGISCVVWACYAVRYAWTK